MERRPRKDRDAKKEFEERVVTTSHVARVVKGRHRFRFTALVVIDGKKDRVGSGAGRANEVPDAVKKIVEDAKRNVFTVPVVGTIIPHVITGRCGAGEVSLHPASEGTGVIADSLVRAVLELAGINNILPRCLGSRTSANMVCATISALKDLKTIEEVARLYDKKPEEIRG